MSKIGVSSMISIDGDVYAMPVDEAFDEHNADRVRAAGHLLVGGTSFRGLEDFWPDQVDNPEATATTRVSP